MLADRVLAQVRGAAHVEPESHDVRERGIDDARVVRWDVEACDVCGGGEGADAAAVVAGGDARVGGWVDCFGDEGGLWGLW